MTTFPCIWSLGGKPCQEEATHQIAFSVWPKGPRRGATAFRMYSGGTVCPKHLPRLRVDDFMEPGAFTAVNRALEAAGRRLVNPKSVKLACEPIVDGRLKSPEPRTDA
jgi:hypothetical protein